MGRWRLAIFGLLGTAVITPAAASGVAAPEPGPVELTGKFVLEKCDSEFVFDRQWCMGFIAGVTHLAADQHMSLSARICPPRRLATDQSRLIVKAYLLSLPIRQNMSATHAVWNALYDAYRCDAFTEQ